MFWATGRIRKLEVWNDLNRHHEAGSPQPLHTGIYLPLLNECMIEAQTTEFSARHWAKVDSNRWGDCPSNIHIHTYTHISTYIHVCTKMQNCTNATSGRSGKASPGKSLKALWSRSRPKVIQMIQNRYKSIDVFGDWQNPEIGGLE